MKIIDIRKKLPNKGSNGKMNMQNIKYCIIHHDAEFMPLIYNSLARYIKHANLHISKGWRHISYHYIIDNIGDIYQCLDENEVGYHAGNLPVNKSSIAVKFDGNFETQKPTTKQVQAYKELMVWLTTKRPDLPKLVRSSVRGHYQIKATACPGKNIKPIISKF
jgi:N-acetyl-anhydromuramyl-L-alanine amidase AmpD